jgi:hypothetical protein
MQPDTNITYIGDAGFGPRRFTDQVATAARSAVEAIGSLQGIRSAEPDRDEAGELKDAQATVIGAFSKLLAAIWKEAGDHNLINNFHGGNEPPDAAEIADWITDNAPHIDPDMIDGRYESQAADHALDMRRGK